MRALARPPTSQPQLNTVLGDYIQIVEKSMDPKLILTVFGTIFLAEIGDKTQLATVLFAAREGVSLTAVFIAASLALIAATAIGVLAGSVVSTYIDPKYLSYVAGVGFIAIGIWTLWSS